MRVNVSLAVNSYAAGVGELARVRAAPLGATGSADTVQQLIQKSSG
jgi:hypothetical protein